MNFLYSFIFNSIKVKDLFLYLPIATTVLYKKTFNLFSVHLVNNPFWTILVLYFYNK